MPPVAAWSPPYVFTLTNPYNGSMTFNEQTDFGLYLLREERCSFDIDVRATKSHIPQADGDILHRPFLTGSEVVLVIELWEDEDNVACDELLQVMADNLSGALRSLLNAGDNEGRLAWEVAGGNERMLDDVRLFKYAKYVHGVAEPTFTVTLDSKYPYAQDLTQTRTGIEDGDIVTITNDGTAEYFPVFQVNRLDGVTSGSPVSAFVIENLTTGQQIVWDESYPGASPIPGGSYAEIATFDNTIYLNGDSTNEKAGIGQLDSEYFPLVPGDNDIAIEGCDMDVLHQAAWG